MSIKEKADQFVRNNGGDERSYINGAYDMLMDVERIIHRKDGTYKSKIEDIIILFGDKVKGM